MKNTRRSLITSTVCLLLCVSMFVGSTFAWFTDSVTSGVNQIVAGNLDVDVLHTNANIDEPVTIEDADAMFTDADGEAMLWEPGAMAYENITVTNVGNLALKYNMMLNIIDFNTVKIPNSTDTTSLLDVLKVKVLTGDDILSGSDLSREGVAGLTWTDAVKLSDFIRNGGALYPDGTANQISSESFQVVVYWQPTENDNIWNINNGKITSDNQPLFVKFGVKLIATQLEHESDSFGTDYDKGALLPTVVDSFDSISALLAEVTSDKPVAIKLSKDIVVPDDSKNSSIKIPSGANVTLDLDGHTISGSRSDQTPNYGMIDVEKNSVLTITNGTVTYGDDGDSSFGAYRDTIAVKRGTLIVKNATINNTCGSGISSAIDIMSNTGPEDAKLIIENSNINGTRYGIRLFGNSTTGSAILDMKNTTVNANSSALFLHQPSKNQKGLIEATVSDSSIVGKSGIYLWDCGNNVGDGDGNIKLTLNGNTSLTSNDEYPDKETAVTGKKDGLYPNYNGEIIVDYSTTAGDTFFKVTDNRSK